MTQQFDIASLLNNLTGIGQQSPQSNLSFQDFMPLSDNGPMGTVPLAQGPSQQSGGSNLMDILNLLSNNNSDNSYAYDPSTNPQDFQQSDISNILQQGDDSSMGGANYDTQAPSYGTSQPTIPVNQISPAIQESLGVPQSQGSQSILDILANRFNIGGGQDQGPGWNDYSEAIQKSAYGKPTSAQSEADSGVANQIKLMSAMNKGSAAGNNTVYAQAMNAINSSPKLSRLPENIKIAMAMGKVGTNLTVDPMTGKVVDMGGAAQGLSNLSQGKETGKNISDMQYKPQIAGASDAAQKQAEYTTQAQIDLPRLMDNGNNAINQIDSLLAHPGFKYAVGTSSYGPIIKGTPAADFVARLDQLKGGAFLQAFATLKGGGQISNIEGEKATAAITRMQRSQSEPEFINAANELKMILSQGMLRAQRGASGAVFNGQSVQPQNSGKATFLGYE